MASTTKFWYGKNKDRRGIRGSVRLQGGTERKFKICLGKVAESVADDWVNRVDNIVDAEQRGKSLGKNMFGWLADLPDDEYEKLAKRFPEHVGSRKPVSGESLGSFLKSYVGNLNGLSQSTLNDYDQVARDLPAHYGEAADLREIANTDGEEFLAYLTETRGNRPSTAAVKMTKAREMLRAAVRKGLMSRSPLEDVRVRGRRVKHELPYITKKEVVRVLAKCSPDWQIVFALARFGGLRCPSESLFLEWAWVDWEKGRFRVKDFKRKCFRDIPIFPSLRPYLRRARALAPSDGKYIMDGKYATRTADQLRKRAIDAKCNFAVVQIMSPGRTEFKRAGGHPPDELFRAMRRAAANDVRQEYGPTCESYWIGHDRQTADDFYGDVRPEDWARASTTAGGGSETSDRGTNRGTSQCVTTGNNTVITGAGNLVFPSFCDQLLLTGTGSTSS